MMHIFPPNGGPNELILSDNEWDEREKSEAKREADAEEEYERKSHGE